LHRKTEELNRGYADLVKRYRDLKRDKEGLEMQVEETRRAYKMMEGEH